jgi:hypothetical protein
VLEQFAGVVVNELRHLEGMIGAVADQLRGKKKLTQDEREQVTAAYTALKAELRALLKTGTVGASRREPTVSEERFFQPAVRQALIALRSPTNTNPLTSKWATQLFEAESEISYHLNRLEKELG